MTSPLLSFAAFVARLLPMRARSVLYHLGPLTTLIRRTLNRAAPRGMSEVSVAAGGLTGAHMLLDMQMEKDYWLGAYEPDLAESIQELVRPGMTAYDVGANIGYVTLMLARAVEQSGVVVAFEALPENLERLRKNIALNPEGQWIRVVHAAVMDASGEASFLVGPSDEMGKVQGSAGRQIEYGSSISVPSLSLDDYVFKQGGLAPQAIKMDIEGGEVLALPGMRAVLRQAQPLMLLELHGPESARCAWEELSAAGYRLCRMAPGFPPVSSIEALDWKAYLVAFPSRTQDNSQ